MILVNGIKQRETEIHSILLKLPDFIKKTRQNSSLQPECVMEACNRLSIGLKNGNYCYFIKEAEKELQESISKEQIEFVAELLSKEALLEKLKTEFLTEQPFCKILCKTFDGREFYKKRVPIGVLFHIAAGNVDGLPVYSVIEGLLAGNINILKLPSAEKGLTIRLLQELIHLEPKLKEYIYVFDTPSTNLSELKQMEKVSDAVVVWGGEEAVRAVRAFARPETKLIEWGHKISFAYLTKGGMTQDKLFGLAQHILNTNQLLCSSCQGIYIDTQNQEELEQFCEIFLPVLKETAKQRKKLKLELQAHISLQIYCTELETIFSNHKVYRKEGVSLTTWKDSNLETSIKFGNLWVKPLPRTRILDVLWEKRGYLQTVGLLCKQEEEEELEELFLKVGVDKITNGENMSEWHSKESHDGEYPLLRYTKVVEIRK